jgi:MFS transporter, AAHS family, 3-hydroxyphenylpropionic acid transporter
VEPERVTGVIRRHVRRREFKTMSMPQTAVEPTELKTTAELKTYRVLILCAIVILLEGFDIQAAGVSATKLGAAFKLTDPQVGSFLSASAFGIFISAILGGLLADRFGRRPVVAIGVTLFGLFSLSTLFAWDLRTLIAARVLTGLGLGAAMPAVIAYASDHSPPHMKKRAVGFIYCAIPIGGLLSGVVMQAGVFGTDWKPVYLVGGIAPVIVAPLLFLLLPRTLPRIRTNNDPGTSKLNVLAGLFGKGQVGATVFLWLATFGTLLVMYLLLGWMPRLLTAMKFSESQSQNVQMLYNIGASLGAASGGYLLDRKLLYSTPLTAYVALAALLAVFGAFTMGFSTVLAVGFGLGITVTITQAALYAFAPLCYPVSMRNTGVGAAVAAGRLGTIVGPLLAGWWRGAGKTPAQVFTSLVPIALAAGLMTLLVVVMFKKREKANP